MKAEAVSILMLIALMIHVTPASAQTAPATTRSGSVAIVVLKGAIDDWSAAGMFKRFESAKASGATTVILQINTWGGQVTSALEMSSFLKRQTDLHVIAFVDEKAISAGALIALACDEIVMQPGSQIGDCAPIIASSQGYETVGDTERAKMESPILSDFYESAIRNGHDPLLTSSMVTIGKTVHWIENLNTGERKFVEDAEYTKLTTSEAGWTPVPNVPDPLDSPSSLLTMHADLAVRVGLANGIASSAEALAAERGLVIASTFAADGGEKFIGLLASAEVRSILTVFFMLSLFAAFRAPGSGPPEAIAAGSLIILVGVPLLTGYATWFEIAAIILGLVFIALEIFIIPGFGLPGITGIILVVMGLVMTFVGAEPINLPGGWWPSLNGTWDAIRRGFVIVVGGTAGAMFLWFWLSRYMQKLPYFSRLVLQPNFGATLGGTVTENSDGTSPWPRIGDVGRAVTDLKPGGTAAFLDDATGDEANTDVISETGFVERNARVVVKLIEGNRIVVRRV